MTDHTQREDENTSGESQQPAQEGHEQTNQQQNNVEDQQRYTTSGILHRITRWLRGR